MTTPICDPSRAQATLIAINVESHFYRQRKPGRVPVADSPNRPALARLWRAAFNAANRRRKLRTFTYCGKKFGIVYIDSQLCVMDWAHRTVLVRPPTSLASLVHMMTPPRV